MQGHFSTIIVPVMYKKNYLFSNFFYFYCTQMIMPLMEEVPVTRDPFVYGFGWFVDSIDIGLAAVFFLGVFYDEKSCTQ